MAKNQRVSRRSLLSLAARAATLPSSAAFFSAWVQAGQHDHSTPNSAAPPQPDLLKNYKPAFFSTEDFAALERFTEILIPSDDTPGAREAHCAKYIDSVLSSSSDYAR